jgi:hypothetical protein
VTPIAVLRLINDMIIACERSFYQILQGRATRAIRNIKKLSLSLSREKAMSTMLTTSNEDQSRNIAKFSRLPP